MKFTCERDELLKYVTYAESIISIKTTITILLNILLETDNGKIKLSSTDFKVGIKAWVNADVQKEGSITLNAKKLLDVLKSFPPCKIIFELQDNYEVKIYSDDPDIKTNFKVKGLSNEEYPTVKGFQEEEYIEIEQDNLKKLIKKTIYAISNQEDRIFLNGIFFIKNGTDLRLVSTDGRRLVLADYAFAEEGKIKKFEAIVPAKVLYELMKILGTEGKCQVAISENENQIFFKIDDVELVSNLLEGKFPNYEQVIPKKHTIEVALQANDFYEAVRRVSTMTDEKTGNVKIIIAKNELILTSNNPELGDGHDRIPVVYDKDEQFEIAFNFNYILEAVREFDEVELSFKATQSQSPVLITGKDNDKYLAIIMPIKLNQQ